MESKTITLNQTKFALQQAISDELALDVNVDVMVPFLMDSVVYEFRTNIWTHKLPPLRKTEHYNLEVKEWKSAWQLWKHNHWYSWWFRFLGLLWLCSTPKHETFTHRAEVCFDIERNTLFPDYNYPTSLGSPYHQVVLSNTVWDWNDTSVEY